VALLGEKVAIPMGLVCPLAVAGHAWNLA